MTEEDKDILTEKEVWDIIEFAKGFGGYGFYGGNALTPMLLNQRMKDITLNPMRATENDLASALSNPKNSEVALQAFSQDFEIISQPYKRLISYLANLLSFDMTYECVNATGSDYKGKAYQKDLDFVKRFFDTFDYKFEFKQAVSQMLRNEAFFCTPRFDMQKPILQELPSSPTYTLITGRWSYGFLMSFNMVWFNLPGVNIDWYPPFFAEAYSKMFKENKPYAPSPYVDDWGGNAFAYWHDLPGDVGFVFKMTPEIAARVPYFTGVFNDLVLQASMRALQKNINMSAANRLLVGEIGLLKEAQSKTRDQFNISPTLLGNFLALVKSAIGESIQAAALPLNNVKPISFPVETTLYNDYVRTTLATTGVNSNLIFSSSQKMTTTEAQLSVDTDIQLMTSLYPQFQRFLSYFANKDTRKFKFEFHLEGADFFTNRQQRFDKAVELSSMGIVLPQKIAASVGMSPFCLERQMEEAKANGLFSGIGSRFVTQKAEANDERGRPRVSDSELTEEGIVTRESGANTERGGKI